VRRISEISKRKFSESITTTKMICFSLQGIISGFLFGMWGQIQYFANAILLIPSMAIPLIYLVFSVIDGINDPLIGYLADKSKRFTSKFGKRFPWIIIGVTIGPIFLVLSFINISSSIFASIVWLIVIMALYETFMTSYEINHNALFPDLFRKASHRRKTSTIGSIIGGLFTIVTGALIPQLISSIGYVTTVIIVVIIAYILIIPYSYGIREPKEMRAFRVELDQKEDVRTPLKQVVKRVFKDKNWIGIVIVVFTWSIAGACWIYGLNFFVTHNLGLDIGATSIPLFMINMVGLVLAPIWVSVSRRIGVKKAYLGGMIANIITYFLFFFVTDIIGVIIVFSLAGIGFSATYGVITKLLMAEGIDNAAVNSGKREEGSYIGILRIFTAFSYFFQTVIFAIVSGFTGYDAALGVGNTDIAKFGLNFQMSIIPVIITVIGVVLFSYLYRISKEDAKEIKEKLVKMDL
jgi:GPH family glycoside/pentoside/hexuronide:cation symporter